MATDQEVLETGAPVAVAKLTKWANEPTVAELKQDLEASKPAHDNWIQKVNRWNDLIQIKGTAAVAKIKGRSSVQPKLIRRQAEWRYSALTEPFLSSEKLYDVKPTTFEDADSAEQNALVLNWQFRTKLNRVNFIDKYVRTATDEGSVIVRTGWNRITIDEEVEVPVWGYYTPQSQEQIQMLEMAVALKTENPREYEEETSEELRAAVDYFLETQQPNIAAKTGTQKEKREKVIYNSPTLDIVNPENFYWDPSCGDDLDKAHFSVLSFETSQAELKKEPNRYKNLDAVNWETATVVVASEHSGKSADTNFNFKDLLRKRVVAYEYWGLWDINKDGRLVPVVATWIGDVLIRLEENPYPDGKIPFVIASYMPIKRELMGESDAELLEDNQKIIGAVSRGMIDLLGRSANSQQGFAKGMLDTLNRRRYENGQDYEFNPNMPPDMGIKEHKYPDIPQSAMLMLTLQNQEAEALTGVKAFSGGMSGDSFGDVAAGIRGVLDAASKREMAILRRLAQGVVEIGKKIISMNQEFLSEEETIRVTNKEFVNIKREDLAGQFDLEVDISTAEVDNTQAQDLGFMLQTIGPNMEFGITKMILKKIAKLKRMPDLEHAIEAYEPQPDPLAEKMKELEIAKLEAEIAEIQSATALNKARTYKEENTADKIDLDKVEQETGTEHERNLELAREQGRQNQDYAVTQALVKPRKEGESRPDIEAAIGYNAISGDLNKKERPKAVQPATPPLQAPMPVMPSPMPPMPINNGIDPALIPPV